MEMNQKQKQRERERNRTEIRQWLRSLRLEREKQSKEMEGTFCLLFLHCSVFTDDVLTFLVNFHPPLTPEILIFLETF